MRAWGTLLVGLAASGCFVDLKVPADAKLTCANSDECPPPLVCEEAVCVDPRLPAPKAAVKASPIEGGRLTEFVFDATASANPDGGALTFEWELDDPTLDPGDPDDFDVKTPGPLLTTKLRLTREQLCPGADAGASCTGAIIRTVRVRVTTAAGAKRIASTVVLVRNTAPRASFGDDLFISERLVPRVEIDGCGGAAGGLPCTSVDPDGDALTFGGWRQVSGPAIAELTDRDGGASFKPVASSNRPVVIEGTVSDGLATSTARVRVYQTVTAFVGTGLPARVYRLFPDSRVAAKWQRPGLPDERVIAITSYQIDADQHRWVGGSDTEGNFPWSRTFVARLDRDLAEVQRWEVPGAVDAGFGSRILSVVPATAAAPGCAAFDRLNSQLTSAFLRLSLDGGIATHGVATVTPKWVFPIGTTGDCWTVANKNTGAASEVGRLSPTGQWTPEFTFPGVARGAAVQPDGTLWVSEDPGGFIPNPPALSTLHRVPATGARTSHDFAGLWLVALGPGPDGAIFAVDQKTRTLLRVAPDFAQRKVSDGSFSQGLGGQQPLGWDPADRAVWIGDGASGQIFRLVEQADGTLVEERKIAIDQVVNGGFGNSSFSGVAVDPVTGGIATVAFGSSDGLPRFVVLPPSLGRLVEIESVRTNDSAIAGDPSSGALWIAGDPVTRVTWTGRVTGRFPNAVGVPVSRPIAVDRLGRAWVGHKAGTGFFLRGLDRTGAEVAKVATSAEPSQIAIDGDTLCTLLGNGDAAARYDLGTGTLTVFDLQGAIVQAVAAQDGKTCFFATQPGLSPACPMLPAPFEVLKFGPADVTRASATPTAPYLRGLAVDAPTGHAWTAHWDLCNYGNSAVLNVATGVQIRDAATEYQVPLNVKLRRRCASTTDPACLEVWTNFRTSQIRRFDGAGTLREIYPVPIGESGRFDLVP